ncbi:MAG: protein-glutamate O-methyltransferase [Pseudomonadota bacterium]
MSRLASALTAQDGPPSLSREDAAHFQCLADIAYARAGLVLQSDKAPMVLARIGKRIRAAGTENLAEYCAFLQRDEAEEERRELIYTLTTNVTNFMREEHHFATFRNEILPDLMKRAREGHRIRFWSAGCSTGQEPYTLAMLIHDAVSDAATLDIKILATDIDIHVLGQARRGEYSEQQCETLPAPWRSRFLEPITGQSESSPGYRVQREVRGMITFNELNLLSKWPIKGQFQAIFCRNVVIYFDRETQRKLWVRFASALEPGGYLFLGHSERLDTAEFPQFKIAGTTTYRVGAAPAPKAERM